MEFHATKGTFNKNRVIKHGTNFDVNQTMDDATHFNKKGIKSGATAPATRSESFYREAKLNST